MKLRKSVKKAIAFFLAVVLVFGIAGQVSPVRADEVNQEVLPEIDCYVGGAGTGAETVTLTTENAHSGSYAAKYSGVSTDTSLFLQNVSGIELGTTYTYTAWICSSAAVWIGARVIGNNATTVSGPGILLTGGEWTEMSVNFKYYTEGETLYVSLNGGEGVAVESSNGSLSSVALGFGHTQQAHTFYVDDISLYAEGDTTNNLIEDGSFEAVVPAEIEGNLFANGTFESGTVEGYFVGGNAGGAENLEISKEVAHTGLYSAKLANKTIDNTTFVQSYDGVEVAKKYTYTAWVYSPKAIWIHAEGIVHATAEDGTETTATAAGKGILLKAGEWTKVVATYAVYETNGNIYIKTDEKSPVAVQGNSLNSIDFAIGSGTSSDILYFDDLTLFAIDLPKEVEGNMFVNGTIESGTIEGYFVAGNAGGAETLEASKDVAHTGLYSAKLGNKTIDNTTFVQSSDDIEIGKTYSYTAWVYSPKAVWIHAEAVAHATEDGTETTATAAGKGILLKAGEWTEVIATYDVYEENGNIYIKTDDKTAVQIEGSTINSVDFAIGSTTNSDTLYFDDLTLFDITEPDDGNTDDGNTSDGDNTDDGNTEDEGDVEENRGENLFINPGFEDGTMNGFTTQGDNIVATLVSDTHSGDYALKLTERRAASEMPIQSIAGEKIELGKWYDYSVWVKSSKQVWAALVVTPWATGQETGAMIWNDLYGDQKVIRANEWTEYRASFCFTVEDGIFYVTDGLTKLALKNHAGTGDVTFDSLVQIDFKVNAQEAAEYYIVDDFYLSVAEEAPEEIYIENKKEVTDYTHSFAVIGDIQTTVQNEPQLLHYIYDYILNNQDEKKIEIALGLGDIVNLDTTAQWEAAESQIDRLNGKIDYSLVRGNHDTVENINKYFATEEYMSQFEGFYKDGDITNSWRTFTAGGIDYLLVTLDYFPSDGMLEWAGDVIEEHPNHRVIITTHAYMDEKGKLISGDVSSSGVDFSGDIEKPRNNGEDMWDKLISQYENIALVLCGHVMSDDIVMRQDIGVNGNTVTALLVDPQDVDAKWGAQGLVAMLYFDQDGDTVTVEYYATAKGAYFKEANQFKFSLTGQEIEQDDIYEDNTGGGNEGTEDEGTENEGTENESTESEDTKVTYEELFDNVGFEAGNFDGYSTQGDNIKVEVITEDAHDGNYSAKVTDFQSANEMMFQSLSGDEIKLNEWYHFSAWVKPTTTSWCALIVTPWATGEETGGMMWNDSYYSQVAEAGVWTKLECSYMFYIEDGKLYVTNGTESKLIQNHAGTGDVTFDSLVQVDFKVNTEDYVEVLYVDDMSLMVESDSIKNTGDNYLFIVTLIITLAGCSLVLAAVTKRRRAL